MCRRLSSTHSFAHHFLVLLQSRLVNEAATRESFSYSHNVTSVTNDLPNYTLPFVQPLQSSSPASEAAVPQTPTSEMSDLSYKEQDQGTMDPNEKAAQCSYSTGSNGEVESRQTMTTETTNSEGRAAISSATIRVAEKYKSGRNMKILKAMTSRNEALRRRGELRRRASLSAAVMTDATIAVSSL